MSEVAESSQEKKSGADGGFGHVGSRVAKASP